MPVMIPTRELPAAAAAILDSYPIAPDALIAPGTPLTRSWLSYCFKLFIDIDEQPIADETRADPRASRALGRPFLPSGLEWPQGYYFYAQLEMHEVAPCDPYGLLPERGTLYLFFDPGARDFHPSSPTAAKALFVDDERTPRVLHPLPDKSKLPLGGKYYLKEHVATSYRLRFAPAFAFQNPETIPTELVAALTERLGIRNVTSSANLFGEPITWQGEDGEEGLFAPDDWDWRHSPGPSDPDRVLLLQRTFSDGHAHIWARRDRIVRGDFSGLQVTASVT